MRVLRSLFGVVAVFACAAAADATGSVRPGTLSVAAGVIGTPESYVGTLPAAGPATRAYLSTPAGLAVDQAGDLYVADPGSDVILKVTPAGMLSIVAGTGRQGAPTPGPAMQSDLNDPWGLAVDAVGNLYIADIGNKVVEKVSPAGTLSIVAGTGRHGAPTPGPATQSDLARPQSVAVGPSGDLYIADLGNNDVDEVTPDGTLSVFAGTGAYDQPTPGLATSSRLDRPDGVAVSNAGDVYIADEAASAVILKVTPSERLSIVAGMLHHSGGLTPGPATKTTLGGPFAVAVDSAGDLFVADFPNNSVEEVTPAGVISIIAGTGATGLPGSYQAELNNLVSPQGIAVGPTGTLYIASTLSRIVEEEAEASDAHSFGAPTAAVGSARVQRATITQTLSCISGASPCRMTMTLKTAVSDRRITLARRRLTIAVGSFKTMTLSPNRAGRLLLRKLGALRTSLTVTAHRPTHLTTRFRGTFRLKSRAS